MELSRMSALDDHDTVLESSNFIEESMCIPESPLSRMSTDDSPFGVPGEASGSADGPQQMVEEFEGACFQLQKSSEEEHIRARIVQTVVEK